jgi:hypothetical protein
MAYNPKNLEIEKAIKKRSKATRHASLDYKPPRHFRIFRNLLVGGIIAAITAVLYTLYWFAIATNLKAAMSEWIAERASQGVVASYRKIEISGFPLNFKIVVTKPKMQTSNSGAPGRADSAGIKWLWQGERAVAEMKPWNFKKFNVDLSGTHNLTYGDEGGTYQFSGQAQKLIMVADIYSDGWPEKFQLNIAGLNLIENTTKAILSAKSVLIKSHRLKLAEEGTDNEAKLPTYSLQAEMHNIQLPNFLNLPLGHNIQELKTEMRVIGHLKPSLNVHNLAAWRDAGGIIEFGLLEGTYGVLKTHASGTIALDENLQPLAAMTAKFQGFFPAINALKRAGYIRSRDAAMAAIVLGVLSRRNSDGQRSISLPLFLQDGQLSAGPAPLMAIPAIDWGEDPPAPKKDK